MKSYLPIFLAGSLLASRASAESLPGSTNFAPAVSPEIVIEGRYAPSNGIVRLGFCGTALHFRYHGSRLSMRVNASSDEVYFDVDVDGGEPVRLRAHAGEADYPLLNETVAGDHVLEITRRSESWQGTCEILGFDLGAGGRLLAPPPLP